MPLLIAGGLVLSGVFYTGGEAAEKTTKLVKWVTVGGSLYLAYQYTKSTGIIK